MLGMPVALSAMALSVRCRKGWPQLSPPDAGSLGRILPDDAGAVRQQGGAELARGAPGIAAEIAIEMCLVIVAAGDRELRPAFLVRRTDAVHRMGEAQDVGD